MWGKLFLGWGVLISCGLLSASLVRGVFTRAVPLIKLVRGGALAEGTVLRLQVPVQSGFRTPRPFIEFPGPDGRRVRYQDVFANKGTEKPGDRVQVRFDPRDPQRATTQGVDTAHRYLWGILTVAAVFALFAVAGLLVLLDIIPVGG
jgi:hypothetical protein